MGYTPLVEETVTFQRLAGFIFVSDITQSNAYAERHNAKPSASENASRPLIIRPTIM